MGTSGLIGMIFGPSGALSLLVLDPLRRFSWWTYLASALLYSALVFGGEASRKGRIIFSEQNVRGRWSIVYIHLLYLVALLGMIELAALTYPFLPPWATDTQLGIGSNLSMLEITVISAMVLLQYIERQFLYVKK